jgi:hypothetical protein
MIRRPTALRKAVDVRAWLEDHGLGQYAEAFASNDVDAEGSLWLPGSAPAIHSGARACLG